jgi:catechol 2,3-dioxygenase-like lactoylglutathione lyase family enzyme
VQTLGFHHAAIQVKDVERVTRFYRDVIGLTELTRYHLEDGTLRSVWLALSSDGDAAKGFFAVELAANPAAAQMLSHSMLALRIAPDAREATIAALTAADVPVFKQTQWTLYVRDPEGNVVGLSHHPHSTPSV